MSQSGQNFHVKKTILTASMNSIVVENEVTLYKDSSLDFGITVRVDAKGYAYIKDIRPDGPAHKSRVIRKLDRILQVNGELVERKKKNNVRELFFRYGDKVELIVRSVYEVSKILG